MRGALIVITASVLAACNGGSSDPAAGTGARQTRMPGIVTAGGNTSGTVMAAASAAGQGKAKDMGGASLEAGTPGIPLGSGGNTGGAQLGGTTGQSALGNTGEQTAAQRTPGQGAPGHAADTAVAAAPPASSASAPRPPASSASGGVPTPGPISAASAAALAAAAQKQQLDERMTRVAERWQQRAALQGWPVNAQPAIDAAAQPPLVRSEKAGTAPPSRDVKQPRPASAKPAVAAPGPASAASR